MQGRQLGSRIIIFFLFLRKNPSLVEELIYWNSSRTISTRNVQSHIAAQFAVCVFFMVFFFGKKKESWRFVTKGWFLTVENGEPAGLW